MAGKFVGDREVNGTHGTRRKNKSGLWGEHRTRKREE